VSVICVEQKKREFEILALINEKRLILNFSTAVEDFIFCLIVGQFNKSYELLYKNEYCELPVGKC
jgi:hypothetical protein